MAETSKRRRVLEPCDVSTFTGKKIKILFFFTVLRISSNQKGLLELLFTYIGIMRANKTYSINVEVLKEFDASVPASQRSRVLDSLMIEYLVKEGIDSRRTINTPSDLTKEDIINEEDN